MATYRRILKDKDGNNIIPAGLLDAIYPVGSIYMSATLSTVSQVQSALGGVWEKWGAGRVPVGVDTSQTEFNSVGKTGGAKTHTHEFGMQFPIFYGDFNAESADSGLLRYDANGNISLGERNGISTKATNFNLGTQSATGAKNSSIARYTGNVRYDTTLQPYITCYMYKRTA